MKNNTYRKDFINKLYCGQIKIKIKKPSNGFFKFNFGRKYDEEEDYGVKWVLASLKLNDDGILINNYMINFNVIKSIELIKPQLFSSGYIELHDYFNNYLQIKTNNSYLKLLFEILNEKIDI